MAQCQLSEILVERDENTPFPMSAVARSHHRRDHGQFHAQMNRDPQRATDQVPPQAQVSSRSFTMRAVERAAARSVRGRRADERRRGRLEDHHVPPWMALKDRVRRVTRRQDPEDMLDGDRRPRIIGLLSKMRGMRIDWDSDREFSAQGAKKAL